MDLKLEFDRNDYSNEQTDELSESASECVFINRLRNCLQIDL